MYATGGGDFEIGRHAYIRKTDLMEILVVAAGMKRKRALAEHMRKRQPWIRIKALISSRAGKSIQNNSTSHAPPVGQIIGNFTAYGALQGF